VGEPAFRAKQVHRQLWKRAATYDRMPDVPPRLRERLQAELPMQVEALEERAADGGATRKALLRIGERPRPPHGADGDGDRHVTVSTVGVAPAIRRLAGAYPQVGLAAARGRGTPRAAATVARPWGSSS